MNISILSLVLSLSCLSLFGAEPVVHQGTTGPGVGKHIVFLAGDHEYRSEETLPALARILAKHHGFRCTVLFTTDPKTGEIAPSSSHMPGMAALDSADLAVVYLRFQNFPDADMKHFVDYFERGGPVVGLRTMTHAFKIPKGKSYSKFSWEYKGDDYLTGWGHQVLGQSWVGHYGKNHRQSTRLDINPETASHPILRGVKNLKLYTEAAREVANANGALFVDAFTPTQGWGADVTVDGALFNEAGYEKLAPVLADALFGGSVVDPGKRSAVHAAVVEKNFTWLNDFKMPNGVHVFGRRYNPYGPGNYPFEIKKTRQMTANRDQAIRAAATGRSFDLAAADAETIDLPPVKTNYRPSGKNGTVDYLPGEVAETKIEMAEVYEIGLFASEKTFPDLKNPVQIAFDNKGRLWVATMESYPHYRIGDPRPKDKLLILEDTNKDGVADKQTVFADDLHIPSVPSVSSVVKLTCAARTTESTEVPSFDRHEPPVRVSPSSSSGVPTGCWWDSTAFNSKTHPLKLDLKSLTHLVTNQQGEDLTRFYFLQTTCG